MTATEQAPGAKAPQERDLMTPQEVAVEVGMDQDTILDYCKKGITVGGQTVVLAGYKVGNKWRIPRAALVAFVRACNPGRSVVLQMERNAHEAAERAAHERLDKRLGGKPSARKE